MNQAAQKQQAVQFPDVVFEAPKFQVSAFGLAHRAIKVMRDAGMDEKVIDDYKEQVKGLSLDDAMVITRCYVRII